MLHQPRVLDGLAQSSTEHSWYTRALLTLREIAIYRIQCKQCGASVVTENGNSDALACPCCPEQHSHEAKANACPGAGSEMDMQHLGADCTAGDTACNVLTPVGEPCRGGHCYPGVPGCQVCRPCNIEWLGVIPVTPAVVRA